MALLMWRFQSLTRMFHVGLLSGLFTKKKKKKRLELPTLNLYGDNYIPLSKHPNKQTHTFRLLHHNPKLCQGPTLQAGSGALS